MTVKSYLTNNYCAYKYDAGEDYYGELKLENFVPTYDKWCLGCTDVYKPATKKCSKCKSVYFCSKECQLKCWPIHKKHCKRDLFTLCITCGRLDPKIKCSDCELPNVDNCFSGSCPVKFCSEECKDKIFAMHKEHDCEYFSKTFGSS